MTEGARRGGLDDENPMTGQEQTTPLADTREHKMEIAQVMALLDDLALDRLEETTEKDGRSVQEVITALEATPGESYEQRRGLTETLLQRLDIAEIRGKEQSPEILDVLKRQYREASYSDLRQTILQNELPKDDVDVLMRALSDKKYSESDRLLYELDNGIRERLYEEIKEKSTVKKIVTLISSTSDLSLKARLLEDFTAWATEHPHEEVRKEMRSGSMIGYLKRDVGVALMQKDRGTLFRLLENGTLGMEGLEESLKDEPTDASLLELLPHVRSSEDAARVLKFIREKDAVSTGAEAAAGGAAFPAEQREILTETARRLAAAFDNPASIVPLGALRPSPPGQSSYEITNKFVIGLAEGEDRATIAWSNIRDYQEHRNLARALGGLPKALCAGGAVKITTLEDGRTRVVFDGRSGTYGPYNQSFLERFRDAIAKELQEELGTDVEVIIEKSGMGL